jgi:hypothetical protein
LFYYLWGRLTYHPEEGDETLAQAFENRYPEVNGRRMLQAYSLASRVPLYLASFYKGTWDFTLYSEGFLSAWPNGFDDGISPFISIEEMIKHETLDTGYVNIEDYCRQEREGLPIGEDYITPPELARKLQIQCSLALEIINNLREAGNEPALSSELDDLETWCHLGFYFADKLMAGVSLENYRLGGYSGDREDALEYLDACIEHWDNVVRMTRDRYRDMPYVSMGHHNQRWPEFQAFHWEHFRDEVIRDRDHVNELY